MIRGSGNLNPAPSKIAKELPPENSSSKAGPPADSYYEVTTVIWDRLKGWRTRPKIQGRKLAHPTRCAPRKDGAPGRLVLRLAHSITADGHNFYRCVYVA